jgi:hypothetical protein
MKRVATSAIVSCLMLAGCASGPPAPEWQMNAKDALERSVAAYFEGNTRVEAAEFGRGRADIARTGKFELAARAELLRCAGRVASLAYEGCPPFDALRADAPPAERAYADYLAGTLQPADAAMLPPQHRAVATASAEAAPAALAAMADPLARLVAAGVLFRTGRASPAVQAQAVETASSQGWRRPLLAWLNLQAQRAEQGGAREEAERLRRRIALVTGPSPAGAPAGALAPPPQPSPQR